MADSVLAIAPRRRSEQPRYPELPRRDDAAVPAHLVRRLERLASSLDLNDRGIRERLIERLTRLQTGPRMWLVLSLLEFGTSGAWEGPARLAACTAMAEQRVTYLRFAAYRWLARLYTVDLRCEMRAKRALGQAMAGETGMAARRVAQLLRAC